VPKTKGAPAIKAAQETRWRLLVRNPTFLKEVEKLHKTIRKGGRASEEQLRVLGERWGIPGIPWELIQRFYSYSYRDEASRYALYDWCGLQYGGGLGHRLISTASSETDSLFSWSILSTRSMTSWNCLRPRFTSTSGHIKLTNLLHVGGSTKFQSTFCAGILHSNKKR
jgi:hypothetical protein